MNEINPNQLKIFKPFSYPLFSDSPCEICFSTSEVLNVLFLMPGKKIRQFAFLCFKCRSHASITKE